MLGDLQGGHQSDEGSGVFSGGGEEGEERRGRGTGRRVSSLGDEMYYTLEDQVGGRPGGWRVCRDTRWPPGVWPRRGCPTSRVWKDTS